MVPNLSDFATELTGTLLDAAQVIQSNHSRAAVVVGDEGKIVGVITEGDLLRALLHGATIHADIAPFVRRSFTFLRHRDEAEALALFSRHGFSMIPVVDEEFRLVDVITINELLPRVRLA